MGSYLFPLLVFMIFAGIFAIEKTHVDAPKTDVLTMNANTNAQQFIAYRDAVAAYLQSHPAYIGAVPSAALISMGYQFSPAFLAAAGNYITQVGGGSGRIITCYGNFAPGTLAAALTITSNDASLGIASSGNWTSYAQGVLTTPQPLATPVSDGSMVSVVQIGG